MKKRMLSLTAVLGTSFLLLTGFDSDVTPEKILEDMNAAMGNLEDLSSFGLDANVDLVLNIEMVTKSGETSIPMNMGIGVSGNIGLQLAEDKSIGLQANINTSYIGAIENASAEIYLVPSGDIYEVYSYESDYGEWTYESVSMDEIQEGLDMIMESFNAIDQIGEDSDTDSISISSDFSDMEFTLSEEPVTVNGVSCYELKTAVDSSMFAENEDALIDLILQSGMAEDEQLMVYYMLSGLYADLTYYVDIATSLPVQMTVDLSKTDMSIFGEMMKQSMAIGATSDSDTETSVTVTAEPCMITVNLDMNSIPTVTVPAEALAAKEALSSSPAPATPAIPATPAAPQN